MTGEPTQVHTPTDDLLAVLHDAKLGCPVFDSHVPSSTQAEPLPARYIVVYPTTPRRTWDDLAHTSDLLWNEWQITSVGSTRLEVEWLQKHIGDAVTDARLQAPGVEFEPLGHLEAQPIRPDDDVPGRVVLYGTEQYGCYSTSS